jgi:hypothetical protein
MARYAFLVKYTKKNGTSGTDPLRTTCSCVSSVAEFLGIKDRVYTPSEGDLVDRAAYKREYTKADGTKGTLDVEAGKQVYLANDKAGARQIQLKTGAKTSGGTKKTLSFTFPSFLTVAEIADALGELIPSGKVATTGTTGASEVEPFFTIKGGRTYPIVPSATATASTATAVATTEAAQVTIATTTKSRKKKVAEAPSP